MAIVHPTTLQPTKPEVLETLFGAPVEILGTYRFDDPEGEVGVEGFILSIDGALRHCVLTYRGAPLEDAEEHLIATMEHGVLGTRWVYDGLGDPVALACFQRALRGQQDQAKLEVYDGDVLVETREPTARVRLVDGSTGAGGVAIAGDLSAALVSDAARLVATWDGGEAVVAALG